MSLFKEKLAVDGVMPQRALLRLKRAGIAVYRVEKPQKSRIVFCVKKKDVEKVFAIYPKVCYNRAVYSPFTVTELGAVGLGKTWKTLKSRTGLWIGVLLFCAVGLAANQTVLGVEFVGSSAYKRETLALLAENGIRAFAPYQTGKEDVICSKLLSLPSVEFCSVKKTGLWLRVETRLGNFSKPKYKKGDMVSSRSGKILSMVTLSGTPLKAAGDEVQQGQTLVGAWFVTPNGESEQRTKTDAIARVRLACRYEGLVAAEDEQSAFAQVYLLLELSDGDCITQKQMEKKDGAYRVCVEYEAVQSWNI